MGKYQQKNVWLFVYAMSTKCAPNGLRYALRDTGGQDERTLI
jgi:hypothetical protein